MTGKNEWFNIIKESYGDSVKLGDNTSLQVEGAGEVPMVMLDEKMTYINGVMYVLKLQKNLISVNQIVKKNMQIQF